MMQVHIPRIADGAETLLSICARAELLSERADQIVNPAITGIRRPSQRDACEVFPCKYLPSRRGQDMQNIEFRCRAIDGLSATLDYARSSVENEIVDSKERAAET